MAAHFKTTKDSMKLYHYPKCSTCKNAIKFLDKKGIDYKAIDISEKPPTLKELKTMLKFQDGALGKLFNTSGKLYRELGLSKKLPKMSEKEALDLLSSNGMLVKRPFLLGDDVGLVGFKEVDWKALK